MATDILRRGRLHATGNGTGPGSLGGPDTGVELATHSATLQGAPTAGINVQRISGAFDGDVTLGLLRLPSGDWSIDISSPEISNGEQIARSHPPASGNYQLGNDTTLHVDVDLDFTVPPLSTLAPESSIFQTYTLARINNTLFESVDPPAVGSDFYYRGLYFVSEQNSGTVQFKVLDPSPDLNAPVGSPAASIWTIAKEPDFNGALPITDPTNMQTIADETTSPLEVVPGGIGFPPPPPTSQDITTWATSFNQNVFSGAIYGYWIRREVPAGATMPQDFEYCPIQIVI